MPAKPLPEGVVVAPPAAREGFELVVGPLLAYEVLTAFFLEATFLGIMLFGMERVSGRMHVASSLIVAFGTTVSAFWILALNSWMHTPAGHVQEFGEIIAGSWLAVIFNPSFPYRLAHKLEGEIKGLAEFGEDHPPVAPVFLAFRVMVGMGMLMLLVAWGSQIWLRSSPPRWLLWTFAGFTFAGWVATLAGWLTTEIGRQPWLVTGILRTAEAVGDASGAKLGASLTAYVLTYAALLLAYMVTLTHLSRRG